MKMSIIIPFYNVDKYLAKCLSSVIVEGRSDYEVIAINDGSTDRSPEIAQEFARLYPGLIRLFSQENSGLGFTRNVGIRAARGEYLMFLDSDDSLCPGAVERILSLLDGEFDVGIFDFDSVMEDGRVLSHTRGCGKAGDFTLTEYPRLLFDSPNVWNKLWRKTLFSDGGIQFPDRIWFEDLATSPRLYLQATTFRSIPETFVRYLQRAGSITNSKNPQRNLEIITVVDSVLDYYREQGTYDRFSAELEFMALYHQFLMASTRLSLIDPTHPAINAIRDNFMEKFPDYRNNPYISTLSLRYRLLLLLIRHRRWRAVSLLMRMNNLVRGKKL